MNMNTGIGGGTITLLLVFLIKLLFVVFVVAIVIGLLFAAKNFIFTPEDVATIKGTFAGNKQKKKLCNSCGKVLDDEWKVCPQSGKEVEDLL